MCHIVWWGHCVTPVLIYRIVGTLCHTCTDISYSVVGTLCHTCTDMSYSVVGTLCHTCTDISYSVVGTLCHTCTDMCRIVWWAHCVLAVVETRNGPMHQVPTSSEQ